MSWKNGEVILIENEITPISQKEDNGSRILWLICLFKKGIKIHFDMIPPIGRDETQASSLVQDFIK
jgi:hypothetical protein